MSVDDQKSVSSDISDVDAKQDTNKKDLYITNIPSSWSAQHLMNYFAKYNPTNTHILLNQTNGFVNFSNHKDALSALLEYNNKRPILNFYPLHITYARNSRKKAQSHAHFWKNKVDKYGRIGKERDLNKLQNLILNHPNNPLYHYEYSCGLASLLDSEIKTIQNPNLIPLWLKHIDIAINLSKKQSKYNKPTSAWLKRKINFCIHIYRTDDNCHNIDIEDLLQLTWNAVINYDKYYFYLPYVRLLYITEREELLTESLKLYEQIWNGNERQKYFKSYMELSDFIQCMIKNGCDLNKIMNVMNECWNHYYNAYGANYIEFQKQTPNQKGATFGMYLMVIRYAEYICNEYEWKVNNKILNQCIKWLKIVIDLRPGYIQSSIELSFCYFFVVKDYISARNVLDKTIEINGKEAAYDTLEKMKLNEKRSDKWQMFRKWVSIKILNVNDNGINNAQDETPMMGDGGMVEPGSKFNISWI